MNSMSGKVYNNIDVFLGEYERENVIFCYGNNAVAHMAKNLVISANSVNTPVVFFALDEKAIPVLSGICDVVKHFDDSFDSDKFYIF